MEEDPAPSVLSTPARPRRPEAPGQRTSTACQICRDKKVKCSGSSPCEYCVKRDLECVFPSAARRKRYLVSHVQELEHKIARLESRNALDGSGHAPTTHQGSASEASEPQTPSTSLFEAGGASNEQPSRRGSQIGANAGHDGPSPGPPDPGTGRDARALAPGSSLSSSDTFGSELKSLLLARSQPDMSSASTLQGTSASPSLPLRRQEIESIKNWPTEEDAYSMLDIVVLNVGISQQLFDARILSDNLSTLYDHASGNGGLSGLCIAECLLVFAIGRLLQARWDDASDVPGQEFFNEALRRLPSLGNLQGHGVLGIEVMGLCALYLQVADRKSEAYLYASSALRLAIQLGLHRSQINRKLQRSEAVHRNRLWWSLYMQERRLAAAGGFPTAIADAAITVSRPSDYVGYPSASAIAVNVTLAQITGRITKTIYSQSNDSEQTFIKEVQDILHSLHKVETSMPSDIAGGLHPSELLLREKPLSRSQLASARTIASLYLTIYQTVIYVVRPILLFMARSSFNEQSDLYRSMSPTLRRLADICVEAARKSLVVLQGLRQREVIAKHAFLDLDCIFSAGFVFVLALAINSARGPAYEGIGSARSILKYLANLGNRAAAKRLTEIDQMCDHLAVETYTPDLTAQPEALMRPFSFERTAQTVDDVRLSAGRMPTQEILVQDIGSEDAIHDYFGAGETSLADIILEGEDDLYWMYHNPTLSLTGVELADWETLENHLNM